MNKRATSLKKNKSKKIRYKHSKRVPTWRKKINRILIQYTLPLIIQVGYTCDTKNVAVSKDRTKWCYLFLSLSSLFFSWRGLLDSDYMGLIESIIGVLLLATGSALEHKELVKKSKTTCDGIRVNYRFIRTPAGTKLVIYLLIALFGAVAYCVSGSDDKWLINLAIFSIEFIDTIISVLVVIFDAEADVH